MPYPLTPPTKSQANRAGKVIRRALRGDAIKSDQVSEAADTLIAFRAAHQYALAKATMGLRSMVQTEGCRVAVSQRLKRSWTILDKIEREPTLALGNMQDIGGCRAVVGNIDELRRVERRLRKNRPPVAVYDYIREPRASGYRAVHVIVEYSDQVGEPRKIEVQLRTLAMHDWAITVERLGGRLNEDLKSGRGPTDVLELLEAVSEAMALEEQGAMVDANLTARIERLRENAAPWLTGRPR